MCIKILALGEILIDFTPFINKDGKQSYEQNPGGAPMNVLTAVKKLGINGGFIGCVGHDHFGTALVDFVQKNQIDTTYLKKTEFADTTLAFVHLYENGHRDFSFYRNPGADQMINIEDIEAINFEGVEIFHFGSLSLTHEPSRSSTIYAVKKAKKKQCLISYDPNYRASLWKSKQEAKKEILSVMKWVDILKVSDEELFFLTGEEDLTIGIKHLENNYHIPLIMVTRGEKGCAIYYKETLQVIDGFKVKAIDTTGAGDSFCGTMLYQIMKHNKFDYMSQNMIKEFATFANKMAAYVTTKFGSASVIPENITLIDNMF